MSYGSFVTNTCSYADSTAPVAFEGGTEHYLYVHDSFGYLHKLYIITLDNGDTIQEWIY